MDEDRSLSFTNFPNPSHGVMHIQSHSREVAAFHLLAIDGREVFVHENILPIRTTRLELDVAPAYYLYTIRLDGRVVQSGGLVQINR